MSFTFEEGSGFSAFALYNAIRLHFTTDSYDFFRYGGKSNVSKDAFANNKAKYSFYKLSRKYNLDELKKFYIANFLAGEVKWIGDITGIEGEENFKNWQKRNQSLTYLFEQDIILLLNEFESPEDMLKVKDGQHPELLTFLMNGKVSIETLVILADILGFMPMWSSKITDDIIWPDIRRRIQKYTPFVNYDKAKFKVILKEQIYENH